MSLFSDFIIANGIWLACACSGLCVFFATFVLIDFLSYASSRYKDRYMEETTVALDDVLLQMPASRIFDFSLALSALAGFASVAFLCMASAEWSWTKAFFAGAIPAVLAFPAPRLILRHLRTMRLKKFNDQLEDALLSISSSLKAGFSITQALDVIANENRKPISFEFKMLTQELRLGVQIDVALRKMVERLDNNADMELVATAIITARQTGGELTQVLERLAGVIRERIRITQRIDALTAQGKLQATIIGAMPFLLMFAMAKVAPDLMAEFFNSVVGVLLIAAATVLVAIGFFVIKKITTIDI